MDYNRIKIEIEHKNISIRELCIKIDVTEQGLHQMIRRKSMKIDVLERISTALDLPVAYWFENQLSTRSIVSNPRFNTALSGAKLSHEKIDFITKYLNEVLKEVIPR